MSRRPRRVGLLATLVAGLAIAFPLGVLAAVSFADVPPGHPFYFDIQAVAEKGVTTGCGGGNYCPDQNVTRGQMAAFMNRLGALAPGKTPVVNADKLDGIDSSGFLRAAPISTQHYGPWTSNGNSTLTVKTWTDITGLDSAAAGFQMGQIPLVAPIAVGSVKYGLASVTVCTSASSNVTITSTYVYEPEPFATIIGDESDRTPGSCYTVTDATPTVVKSNTILLLGLNFTAAGQLGVSSTTATWVPTTAVLADVKSKTNGTTSR